MVKIINWTVTQKTIPSMYAIRLFRQRAIHNQNGINRIQTDIRTPKKADSYARSKPKIFMDASRFPRATQYRRKYGNATAIISTADQLSIWIPTAYRNGIFCHAA